MLLRLLKHRLLFGAAVAASLAAAPLVATPSGAVTNGNVDNAAHPYVGALTALNNGARVLACTGTLVTPTVLVTAAHCTTQVQQITGGHTVDVSFDPNIMSTAATCQLANCTVAPTGPLYTGTMITDPDFVYSSGQSYSTSVDSHDIAVVVFSNAVPVTPAQLPTAGLLDQLSASGSLASTPVTDVGYGWTNVVDKSSADWTGSFDGQRRYANGGFQSLTTSDIKVSENPALGYGGACSHDSGGPAIINNTVVAELSSLQGNQCDSTYDSYRLDTASARSFLSANGVPLP